MLSHILTLVMCMQLLHVLLMHSLRPGSPHNVHNPIVHYLLWLMCLPASTVNKIIITVLLINSADTTTIYICNIQDSSRLPPWTRHWPSFAGQTFGPRAKLSRTYHLPTTDPPQTRHVEHGRVCVLTSWCVLVSESWWEAKCRQTVRS